MLWKFSSQTDFLRGLVMLSDFTVPIPSPIKNILATNLKLGSSGNDVSLLKIVLNSDKDTKIISKSNEVTDIFDLNTLVAVNKFQEKYAKEILVPSGLTSATGFVGSATRKKLNYILHNILVATQVTSTSTATTSTN